MGKIGWPNVGASTLAAWGANLPFAIRWQNRVGGPLNSISIYTGTAGVNVTATLWSDGTTSPSSLLATSAQVASVAGGWITLTFSSPVTLVEDTWYWLAWNQAGAIDLKYNAAQTGLTIAGYSFGAGCTYPNFNFTTFNSYNLLLSVYGTINQKAGCLINSGLISRV
jgi:hypothetical protein